MPENPTLVMPDFGWKWDIQPSIVHSTTVTVTKSGRRIRRPNFPSDGLQRFTGTTDELNYAERRQFKDFFQACRGQLNSFYFFKPDPENYLNTLVGTVTNATELTLPYKDIRATINETSNAFTASIGGVSTAFNLSPGTGAYGSDVISWSGAKTGDVVMSFNGRERIICVFETDEQIAQFMQNSADLSTSFSVSIVEVP